MNIMFRRLDLPVALKVCLELLARFNTALARMPLHKGCSHFREHLTHYKTFPIKGALQSLLNKLHKNRCVESRLIQKCLIFQKSASRRHS